MSKSLSVVIPAYNEECLLKACLQSIADQTVKPDRVFVIDNNSTDRTAEVAAGYSFVTIVRESKQGIVYARNRGFNLSLRQGCDIIGRIDADSKLPPTWVATVKRFYDDPAHGNVALNGGAHFYNLRTGRLVGTVYDFVIHRLNRLILGYYFPWGSNMAMPAELWRRVAPDVCDHTDVHEDLDLGIHLHEAGVKTVYRSRLRVGAVARRIMERRGMLWPYLRMWTHTMHSHRVRLWALTVPLSVGIWCGSYAVFVIESMLNMLAGRKC